MLELPFPDCMYLFQEICISRKKYNFTIVSMSKNNFSPLLQINITRNNDYKLTMFIHRLLLIVGQQIFIILEMLTTRKCGY